MDPSGSEMTVPPALVTASDNWCGAGVRTLTDWRELPATKSATEVSAISLPLPMTTRCSAVSAISAMRWLDTNTVRPSPASFLHSVRTQRMPSGSRPFTGSSNSSTPGSPSRAAAMPRRWPIPSENLPTRLPATE